jgi:acetyltransferase
MLEDENIDTLLVQEELPQVEGTNKKAQNLKVVNRKIAENGGKPVAVISMVSYMFTDYSRGFRKELTHLPVLHEVDKGVRAAAAAGCYGALVARKDDASRQHADEALKAKVAACLKDLPAGAAALDERKSKELLALVGIRSPREIVARTADEAVRAAKDIGSKVVLKVLSADILHKSDIGGVIVGVEGEAAVREAFQRIIANAGRHKPDARLDGVLVAEMISGGVELVAGIQRDPEVGPVVMFGAGGVLLEVAKDVSFGPVPLAPAEAHDMIAATNAGKLLEGYRGQAATDRAAVAASIVALARLADALGEHVEAIDINPLVALPGSGGLVALDGLVVLRGS